MSSSAPIADGCLPFMSLLTAPPDVFSASRGHIQRRQCSVFLRMPLCGDGRIIGLQTILRTWAVSGTIKAAIAADRPLPHSATRLSLQTVPLPDPVSAVHFSGSPIEASTPGALQIAADVYDNHNTGCEGSLLLFSGGLSHLPATQTPRAATNTFFRSDKAPGLASAES